MVALNTIEESLAVTPKGVIDAINRLDVPVVGVAADTGNQYISQISETNGKINAVLATATIGSENTPIWIDQGVITAITGTIANDISGNASTATAFASDVTISLTGDITGSANGTHGWSIKTDIGAGTVTNAMLAGSITNDKLDKSTIGIAGTNIALGSGIDKTTLLFNLGLTNAAHYIGKATEELTDGGTENPTISGYDFANDRKSGDIVLGKDGDKEYIWGFNGWELLGPVDTIQASTGTGIQNRMAYYSAANMISSTSHYTTDTEVAINKTSITNGYSFEVNGNSIYDGNIRLNDTILERLIESKQANGSDWARNIISILDKKGTSFAHLGAYGSAENFYYLYLGSGAYNSANNLRIYPAANDQSEKIAIGRTTIAAAAATLYVKGTPGEFTFRNRKITPVATFDGQTYFTGSINAASLIATNVTNNSTAPSTPVGDGAYYLYGNNVEYAKLYIRRMGLAPTENNGEYSNAGQGAVRLSLGNAKVYENSANGEADNAYGDILLYYPQGENYTIYEPGVIYHNNNSGLDTFSYWGARSTTADEDAYATWVLGNSIKKTSTTAHSEGRLRIYSDSSGYHQIVGASTTGARVHYFPDTSGWIVTGGNGKDTGVGNASKPVYIDTNGITKPISYTIEKSVPNNALFTDTWVALSTSAAGYVAQAPDDTHKFLRGDATWTDITSAKSTTLAWNTESTVATIGGYDIKVKLPANPNTNTDTLVKQTAKSDAIEYKILAGANSNPISGTAYEAVYDTTITLNPSTNTITAANFDGALKGNADTATKVNNALTITLNNSTKTFNGSADTSISFYAPTTGGIANTQALVGNGATTAPKWVNISPSITITDGTASATPKVNVTVLGQSGTAQAITTATTGVYGATKLTDAYTSTDATLAATGKSILAAIQTLDVSAVGGETGEYISKISETNGKISATKATTTVSNSWVAGTTAGPTIKTTVNGITGTAVAIPSASATASGAVTTGAQEFKGLKTIRYTEGHYFYDKGDNTSKFYKIKINSTASWMLTFTIRVYHGYDWNDIVISGYNYTSSATKTWYAPRATMLGGNHDYEVSVYFGKDADNSLWIGLQAKAYTGLDIFQVTNGGSTQIADIAELFTITLVDSLGGEQISNSPIKVKRPARKGETITYTPAGTVSKPTITLTPTTNKIHVQQNATTPALAMSVDETTETLSFSWNVREVSVWTNASATSSTPTFTGTQATITI